MAVSMSIRTPPADDWLTSGAILGGRVETAETHQVEFLRNPFDEGNPFEAYCLVRRGFIIALPISPISNEAAESGSPSHNTIIRRRQSSSRYDIFDDIL